MGVSAHRSFNTYVASVVEVEVDKTGRVACRASCRCSTRASS